jgi:predicted PurR-regulated permease PerM
VTRRFPAYGGSSGNDRSGSLVPRALAVTAAWTWRILLALAGLWVLLAVVNKFYLLVFPTATALLLTALAHPVVAVLRRWGLRPGMALLVAAFGLLLAVAGIVTWIVTQASAQVPAVLDQFSAAIQALPIKTGTLHHLQQQAISALERGQGSLTGRLFTGLKFVGEAVTGVVLTVFITLYLLYDGERVWSWVVSFFPRGQRATVHETGVHVWGALVAWVRGTTIIATIHGVIVGTTLAILGVPLIISLSVLVFVGSFIPIVGAFLFGGLAVLVTFATHGLIPAGVLVLVLLLDNQLEAHVLQPFLMGRYVRLHPLAVVAAITAGGILAGGPGVVFAVPLTAACHAGISYLRSRDDARDDDNADT